MMRPRLAATVLVCAIALSACGGDPNPNDRVPQLGTTLSKVQNSLAEGETERAQAHLRALVDQTTAAREAGDLTELQAHTVLAAAASLLSALPEQAPEPSAPVTTAPPNEDQPGGSGDEDEKPGKGRKSEDPKSVGD